MRETSPELQRANYKSESAKSRSQNGLSLIELIVTMAIVMILTSMAVPRYSGFMIEQRRADAHHLLYSNASRLQRCLTLSGSYELDCNLKTESAEGYYELTADRTALTWTLTATPTAKNRQDLDSACSTIILHQSGEKTATGGAPNACW